MSDDGALPIVPAARVDARLPAHCGLGPVGADHEAGAELPPITEPEPHRVAGRLERRKVRAEQHDALRLRARGERRLDRQVLADVAKVRLAELGGVEDERVRAGRVLAFLPDHHPLVRGRARGDCRPCAGALEELLRCARQRGNAQVERRVGGRRGRGPWLDERDPEPRGCRGHREQRSGAGACHRPADHDDVEVALHARPSASGSPRTRRGCRPASPIVRRANSRLTGRSRSKSTRPVAARAAERPERQAEAAHQHVREADDRLAVGRAPFGVPREERRSRPGRRPRRGAPPARRHPATRG